LLVRREASAYMVLRWPPFGGCANDGLQFGIFAMVWPLIVAALAAGFAFFLGWLEDRAERRREHAAE
jgi:hypothetical protein